MYKKFCNHCKTEFSTREKRGKYCSPDCWYKSRSIEVVCGFCGREFLKPPCFYKRSKRHFCSTDCLMKWRKLPRDKEWKEGISKARKEYFTNDNREKMSGENHWNWKGGVTPESVKARNSKEMAEWRITVFERDGYTCVRCLDDRGGNLCSHHIIPFSIVSEERFEVSNGATLCEDCHNWIHLNEYNGITNSVSASNGLFQT